MTTKARLSDADMLDALAVARAQHKLYYRSVFLHKKTGGTYRIEDVVFQVEDMSLLVGGHTCPLCSPAR
jgi:hypothetical protein